MESKQKIVELKFRQFHVKILAHCISHTSAANIIKSVFDSRQTIKKYEGVYTSYEKKMLAEFDKCMDDYVQMIFNGCDENIKNKVKLIADDIINYACESLKLNGCSVAASASDTIYVRHVTQEQLIFTNNSIIETYGKFICLTNPEWD